MVDSNEDSVPLIYTTKGNVPITDLDYKHFWEDGLTLSVLPETREGNMSLGIKKGGQITHIEEYCDKQSGEVVKRNVAVYLFNGMNVASEQGEL